MQKAYRGGDNGTTEQSSLFGLWFCLFVVCLFVLPLKKSRNLSNYTSIFTTMEQMSGTLGKTRQLLFRLLRVCIKERRILEQLEMSSIFITGHLPRFLPCCPLTNCLVLGFFYIYIKNRTKTYSSTNLSALKLF